MYRVDKNNYFVNEKQATVYTPAHVCDFVFSLVRGKINREQVVLDPCVGKGALLKPFAEKYMVAGIDIEDQGFAGTRVQNYLEIGRGELETPGLVIMNPPFNIDKKTKRYIQLHYAKRPLLPELWLAKTVELFGKDVPIVLFAPIGLRLNQSCNSKRWLRFTSGMYPEITSIISLPKDVFKNIQFHCEILLFNIFDIRGHYFCPASKEGELGIG